MACHEGVYYIMWELLRVILIQSIYLRIPIERYNLETSAIHFHIFVLRMFYDDVCNRSTTLLSINDTCAYLTIVFQYEYVTNNHFFSV